MSTITQVSWNTSMGKAIESGNIAELTKLLDVGISPDLLLRDESLKWISGICAAIKHKQIDIFWLLIERGASTHVGHGYYSPLAELIRCAFKNMYTMDEVKSIVRALGKCSLNSETTLDLFCNAFWMYERDSFDLIDYMFETFEIDVNKQYEKGYTILIQALQRKVDDTVVKFVEYFLAKGADLDLATKKGTTARKQLNQKSKKDLKMYLEQQFNIVI